MLEFSFLPIDESGDLLDDLKRVFAELAESLGHEHRAYSGEYHPALDVLETPHAVEIVVDVAGVPSEAIRVLFKADILIVAGEKGHAPSMTDPSLHLLEREFGRFARAVRLSGAFEIARAQATIAAGELTIVLPKRADRRGQSQRIPVTTATPPSA